MKRLFVSLSILVAAFVVSGVLSAQGSTNVFKKDQAVIQFTEPVKLLDVFLKGEYVFVHDDAKMAKGEPCTYVYKSLGGQQGKLVVSFHCVPIQRAKTDRFTVLITRTGTAFDVLELKEIQFAGSAEGHGVPGVAAR
ncbi:MAG TPA: hypothetical protein VJH03_23240 [Blastocatellia bacterium]|nr:hypothetical protein [Blastocatellia bacterium]